MEEFIPIFDFEEKQKPSSFVSKTFDEIVFKDEITYHEASHFVFGRFLSKYCIGFTEADYIKRTIRCCKQRFYGKSTSEGKESITKFYQEDPRRLKGNLLKLIAGYAS